MSDVNINDDIIKNLAFLIEQDTQNPPRKISGNDELFSHLHQYFVGLGFTVKTIDLGDGHVVFYAIKGQPEILFNAHLDTVPVDSATLSSWDNDPLTLTVADGKAYGRGSCDIKGATACLMTLASQVNDLAVVLTTDEEGKDPCCVQSFIDTEDLSSFDQVIVAEPTMMNAVASHRGYLSAQVRFTGQSGHSSLSMALDENAIHKCAKWLDKVLQYCHSFVNPDNPAGLCFNVGSIKGGEKNNMIAETAEVHFSMRIPSDLSTTEVIQKLQDLVDESNGRWRTTVFPSLPANQADPAGVHQFCQGHQLSIAKPVDFWTEASLFSQAGFDTMVLGPGDIQQAHSINEWVSLSQLYKCYQVYADLVAGGKSHEHA